MSNEEDCPPCKLKAGIKLLLESCVRNDFDEVNCEQVKEDWLNGTYTHEETINILAEGAKNNPVSAKEFDVILNIMVKEGIINDA